MFDRLAVDQRGLPAIADFFDRLLRLRCTGEFAGWGCLVSNAHLEHPPDAVHAILTEHHAALRDALSSALKVAQSKKQLSVGIEIEGVAEMLTLLAYAVNLRSRAGVARSQLEPAVNAALASCTAR
jgi:TetR/AcrR family transcriptional repressor of nem operon